MAIAFHAGNSFDGTFTNGAGTKTVDLTFDAGASASNTVLYVLLSRNTGGAHTISGITYQGDALTALHTGETTSGACGGRVWRRIAPATGSGTLQITYTGTLGTSNINVIALVYSGVDQTTPEDGLTPATGTDTTAEVTVTSEVGDAPLYMSAVRALTPTGYAATNYTERADNVNAEIMATGGEGTGAASLTMTGTISATAVNNWVAIGLNMNAAAGGGGATASPYYMTYYRSIVTCS